MRENKVIIWVTFSCFEDTFYLWTGGVWQSVLSTSKGKVVNQLLLCIHLFLVIPICCAICGVKPKYCDRSYVHSCIPWILDDLPNDPWVGTANDFDCSFWWLSNCVGRCFIARPWFSWGLAGLVALPSHL